MKDGNTLIPIDETNITNLIYTIRGKQVMIDRDLADLYQVQTKRLNEQVKRNLARFPEEFCFRLSTEEKNEPVANCDRFTTPETFIIESLCLYGTRHCDAISRS